MRYDASCSSNARAIFLPNKSCRRCGDGQRNTAEKWRATQQYPVVSACYKSLPRRIKRLN